MPSDSEDHLVSVEMDDMYHFIIIKDKNFGSEKCWIIGNADFLPRASVIVLLPQESRI